MAPAFFGTHLDIPAEGTLPAIPAFAVLPEGASRGVVVLHELLGPQPEFERVVERLGRAGYAAVAPDLFAGGTRLGCIRALLRATATGEGPPAEAVLRARRWLSTHARIEAERIGLIGFCITGAFVLAVGRGWGAVSTNYGGLPPRERLAGIGPVIACYGGRDRAFGRTGEELRRALEPLGVRAEIHTFPSVGHSFLTDGHHPVLHRLSRPLLQIRYDAAVAEDAWSRILAFFDRNL
jgi:carboxymethylenebutenolidase